MRRQAGLGGISVRTALVRHHQRCRQRACGNQVRLEVGDLPLNTRKFAALLGESVDDGRSLTEDLHRDIRTTMGLMVNGYPNLFTTAAPLAPSAGWC